LNFLQGLLNIGDEKALQARLDQMHQVLQRMDQGESIDISKEVIPLTLDEIGMIQYAGLRKEVLTFLQQEKIEGVDLLVSFWTKVAELENHPTILLLKERSKALLEGRCVGLAVKRESLYRSIYNLKEDGLRYMTMNRTAQYLFTGEPCHVGFIFSKEREQFFSHMGFARKHEVALNPTAILHPCYFLFDFNIKPLLSKQVAEEHGKELQKFFSQTLQEIASVQLPIEIGSSMDGVEAFCLGVKTPFRRQEERHMMQPREYCTGISAKTLHQVYLKTMEKMRELGYEKKEIAPLFNESDHIGRFTISAFLQFFKQKGMIDLLEDPILAACIASDPLRRIFV
jgi:hypothetical protein